MGKPYQKVAVKKKPGPKGFDWKVAKAREDAPKPTSRVAMERELEDRMVGFFSDPLGFVRYVFPWGEEGRELADESGPDEWQTEILETLAAHVKSGLAGAVQSALQLAISSGHGIGKAQPVDMIIDTPDGRRKWGDICVGDNVFGRDGNVRKVKAVHPQDGELDIYRVTFNDGSSTRCCGNHLWQVKGRQQRRNNSGWITLSTEDIINAGVKRKNGVGEARNFEIPVHGAVHYPERDVPVSPYLLGSWLGNGTRNYPIITTNDAEVTARFLLDGYEIHEKDAGGTDKAHQWYVSGIKGLLRELGVLDKYSSERNIPREYLENDIDVRSELLRGLLDSDGETGKGGSVGYSTTSTALCDDVIWLVRSLGGRASLQPTVKTPSYTGKDGNKIKCRPCYRITITMPRDFRCFYVTRKQERVHSEIQSRYLSRWIDSITPDGRSEAMCITVDAPDNLYLTNDFICTHNTALTSWIVLWFISTRAHPQIVVTANTQPQLATKTWRELAKWHKLSIHSHWFKWTATRFYKVSDPETWYAAAIAWSESNAEAFAGTHAAHVLIIFDEASNIADVIWETTSGAMTTVGAMWCCFGNPTRNTGMFRECFYKFKHRWVTKQIDSRTAKKADKNLIKGWIEDYGADSDYVRVRVLGVFPRSGSSQFIPLDRVNEAMDRVLPADAYQLSPVVIGADVARFGDDFCEIVVRKGLKVLEIREYSDVDTMEFASLIIAAEIEYKADAVFVDAVGIGAGVVDRMRQIGREPLEVNGANSPADPRYYNKRAEMWGLMGDWLRNADIPGDVALRDQLVGIEYGFSDKTDRIQLEKKKDMKARGLPSPDRADALAMTFAEPIMHTGTSNEEYDDFEYEYNNFDDGRSTVTGY